MTVVMKNITFNECACIWSNHLLNSLCLYYLYFRELLSRMQMLNMKRRKIQNLENYWHCSSEAGGWEA